jgi:hypothetical protein
MCVCGENCLFTFTMPQTLQPLSSMAQVGLGLGGIGEYNCPLADAESCKISMWQNLPQH